MRDTIQDRPTNMEKTTVSRSCRLSVIRIANRFEIDGRCLILDIFLCLPGGLADSRRQRVRYYRQARSPKRTE